MNNSLSLPLPSTRTKRFTRVGLDDIYSTELVIQAKDSLEHRGQLPIWEEIRTTGSRDLVLITPMDREHILIERRNSEKHTLSVRNESALARTLTAERLLIDITSLPHNIWAPLLKAAYKTQTPTRVLYAEPDSYKTHPNPASATLFDLSESVEGLAPIPGFARLSGPEDESKCIFVALLGFEGNRPERLALQLDPTPNVIPIVGVPGFQLEYPAFTVACNRSLLDNYRAYAEIRFARASCPFEVFNILNEIKVDFPDYYMYIAPVGTKPHSLGAIWYAVKHPDDSEIMFDYPIRKSGRTKGIGTVHIYDFGTFS